MITVPNDVFLALARGHDCCHKAYLTTTPSPPIFSAIRITTFHTINTIIQISALSYARS